ncbi:Copper amine oxidase N-terminal domain-containing protein [Peptoclostridium litorale DSM 5388]|uniref:stalk domain-containing protein n=1 Tax=Peptoclostridium litorale TaxID=1557 RepID=UPI00092617C0|nr:stalk domain-containing protein [Peptoclostridium litorale]SIN67464.1 Copper amine oxidase N-terminal domain-containing protein [Peptoclostridium litorale DSM 5388]
MFRRFFLFTLILMLILLGTTFSFAFDPNSESGDSDGIEIVKDDDSIDDSDGDSDDDDGDSDDDDSDSDDDDSDSDDDDSDSDDDDGKDEEWMKLKNRLIVNEKEIKDKKDRLEELKDKLEEDYEEAEKSEDVKLMEKLEQEMEKVENQLENLKQERRLLILQRRELTRSRYTELEMEKARNSEDKIKEEDASAKVLPVGSILSNAVEFKFDTPPVIKDGRTLIPVRALTEGFGAKVEWDEESRQAKIEKDDMRIIIILDTNKAIVDDEEIELDVQSQITNSRTYVPLRFVLETFGLEIEWDEETETIIINDPSYSAVEPENFVKTIDNPYFPLIPGTTFVYEGEADGQLEHVEVYVTNEKREVMGITCTVVRDRVWVDDELEEDTYDWFAQDINGNVWYFGEDSKEIDEGKVISTKGSWEAGVDGAQPGIAMKADPKEGDAYRQEYYKGEAEDMAEVISLDESLEVEYGKYDDVLRTKEWTPLEPGVVESKYYAKGVGMILEEVIEGGEGSLELIEIKTQ